MGLGGRGAAMNIKSIIQNIIYGKPQLIETINAPGMIFVTIAMPDHTFKELEVVPQRDIWKRPRQKQSFIKGVYLRLPYAIPFAHSVMYDASWIDIEEDNER